MLNTLRQVRAAVSLLNPGEVRRMCAAPPAIGLVASTPAGYAEIEDFLIPAEVPHERRLALMRSVHRAGDPGAPAEFDLVLYEPGLKCPDFAFTYVRRDPEITMRGIMAEREELGLPLARHFPPFRNLVLDSIVKAVCRENALFAVAAALPNIVPNLLELPWAVGEFASDTAFITINQIRMAYMIGAAADKRIGLSEQKIEVASILAGAFGWRAIARELAGKIPLGGGLIAKGAIAYAGTWVVGKGLECMHQGGGALSQMERRELYNDGLARGRRLVEGAAEAD
jgi:hypothetical protein